MTLVCWSGGCDSTLVLWRLAAAAKADPAWGKLRAVTLTHTQVGAAKEQAAARRAILREFGKRGLQVEPIEIDVRVRRGQGMLGSGLPQAVVWLYATQCLAPTEDLWMGYIKGDDWLCHQSEFREVFLRLQMISGRSGRLHTPLEGTEKRGVIHQLQEAGLLDLTWWCEFPGRREDGLPCGECPSCRTHVLGAWALQQWGPGYCWEGPT